MTRLAMAAFALTLGAQSLKAQINFENFRYRVEAGITSSKVSEFGIGESALIGYRVSGQVLMPFEYSKWALLTGLTLTTKGENSQFYTTQGQNTSTTGTTRVGLTYLQLPINISHRFDLNENNRIYLEFGPYVAMGLAGKVKASDFNLFEKIDGESPFNRFEVGVGASLHYDYKNIYLKGGVEYSLTSVINKDFNFRNSFSQSPFTGNTSRFGLAYVTLGYQF